MKIPWVAPPLLALLCACVPSQAVALLETRRAVNAGHAADPQLPPQARAIAQDGYDADCVLLQLLDDQDLPPEVAERIAARAGGP